MMSRLTVLLFALLGGWLVHVGIASREALEPNAYVAGPGLIPGVGTPLEADGAQQGAQVEPARAGEIRSTVLAIPAPGVASSGAWQRSMGVGCLAAALFLAWSTAWGAATRETPGTAKIRGSFPWLQTLVLIPGSYALWRLAQGVSASAPSAADAREAFGLWSPAAALALLLIMAPRRVPAARR